MKYVLLFAIVFSLCSTFCLSGQPTLGTGAFGFDWLNPASAQCELITRSLREKFKNCSYQADGAFGLADPFFTCPLSDHRAFLVFENESICNRNLETMQANAP